MARAARLRHAPRGTQFLALCLEFPKLFRPIFVFARTQLEDAGLDGVLDMLALSIIVGGAPFEPPAWRAAPGPGAPRRGAQRVRSLAHRAAPRHCALPRA